MIETTDIYRSIRERLEETFENIPVQTKDLKTPKPPCFYIKYVTGSGTQTAEEFCREDCSFDVIYFADEEKLLDLLNVKKKLGLIFKKPLKIKISDKSETKFQYQEIDSVSIYLNEEDYVLNCTLSMAVNQRFEYGEYGEYGGTGNRFDEYENTENLEEIEYTI